jgi:uncharacterized protein (DUF169 family)
LDLKIRDDFTRLWKKYFNNAEMPIIFYYTDEEGHAEKAPKDPKTPCIMGAINNVRTGKSLTMDAESIGCPGGKKWLGFSDRLAPSFNYFLSCGIPGKVEGERYKKTPETVAELLEGWPKFKAPARYIVFKRWDKLEASDQPEIVIFFAAADVLSGLFTLANFDVAHPNGVITPMGSGCSSIVFNPYQEKDLAQPRGVIGLFDISARPFIGADELTFAAPFKKITAMASNMEESFLITDSWKKVQKRIP